MHSILHVLRINKKKAGPWFYPKDYRLLVDISSDQLEQSKGAGLSEKRAIVVSLVLKFFVQFKINDLKHISPIFSLGKVYGRH